MTTKGQKMDTAIILSGGKSSRAGFDKQCMRIHHERIVIYLAKKLQTLFRQVIIVTNKPKLYANTEYLVVSDRIKDYGPVAGIYTGLYYAKSDYAYVMACDMPHVSLPYIQWLKGKAHRDDYTHDIYAVKKNDGKIEPFHGFYAKRIEPVMKKMIQDNIQKLTAVYPRVTVDYVDEHAIKRFASQGDMFVNLNTRDDIRKYFKQERQGEDR